MSQSSSAQRDPSMEEILASIRKIIEEGEDSAPRLKPRDTYEPTAIGPAANDVSRSATATIAPTTASPSTTARIEPATSKAPEVAAVVTAAPEPELSSDTLASLDAAAAEVLSEASDEELIIDDFDIEIDEAEMKRLAPAPAARSAIISDTASRQVTASFSELMHALAANRQRSLDQIAEEVLRPMLQDWLDNNLPTLVEKLVREEIERVARGG